MYTSTHVSMPTALWGCADIEVKDKKANVNMKRLYMPGVALVMDHDNTLRAIWYCNCTTENVKICKSIEILHSCPGECSDLQDADCVHVRYCKYMVKTQGIEDLSELISAAPEYDGHAAGNNVSIFCMSVNAIVQDSHIQAFTVSGCALYGRYQ